MKQKMNNFLAAVIAVGTISSQATAMEQAPVPAPEGQQEIIVLNQAELQQAEAPVIKEGKQEVNNTSQAPETKASGWFKDNAAKLGRPVLNWLVIKPFNFGDRVVTNSLDYYFATPDQKQEMRAHANIAANAALSAASTQLSNAFNVTKQAVTEVGQDFSAGNALWAKEAANRMKRLPKKAGKLITETGTNGTSYGLKLGKKALQTLVVTPYNKVTGGLNAAYSFAEQKTRTPFRTKYVDKPLKFVKDAAVETYGSFKQTTIEAKDAMAQTHAVQNVAQKAQVAKNFIANHNPFAQEEMQLDNFFDNPELNEQRRRENIRAERVAQRAAIANAQNDVQLDQLFDVAPVANQEPQPEPQPQPEKPKEPALPKQPTPTEQPDIKKPASMMRRLMTSPLTYAATAVAIPVMLAVARMAQLVTKPEAVSKTIKMLDILIDMATVETDKVLELLVNELNSDEIAAINSEKYAQLKDYANKGQLDEFVTCAKAYKQELTNLLTPATSIFSKDALMKVFKKIKYGVKADFATAKNWIANRISSAKADKVEAQRA